MSTPLSSDLSKLLSLCSVAAHIKLLNEISSLFNIQFNLHLGSQQLWDYLVHVHVHPQLFLDSQLWYYQVLHPLYLGSQACNNLVLILVYLSNTGYSDAGLSYSAVSGGSWWRWWALRIYVYCYDFILFSFFILFPYILLWTYCCYISFYLHTASCAASFLLIRSYAQSVYSCTAIMHSLFTLAQPLCTVCLLMRSLIVQYIRTGWTLLFGS